MMHDLPFFNHPLASSSNKIVLQTEIIAADLFPIKNLLREYQPSLSYAPLINVSRYIWIRCHTSFHWCDWTFCNDLASSITSKSSAIVCGLLTHILQHFSEIADLSS